MISQPPLPPPTTAATEEEPPAAAAGEGGQQQRPTTMQEAAADGIHHKEKNNNMNSGGGGGGGSGCAAIGPKQKNPSGGLDPRPGGSASSAAPTDDAESQATTTNDHTVDESGDSESGGHNEPGKMFVGGLSWQTTAEGLRDYFCKFGEVNECMVMRDPTTKRARGFGFITFVDPTAVEKVLGVESHELDGKRIDPKIAFPKKQQPKMVVKTKKVFIGGLSSNSTLEDLKAYFSQYGRIDDAMLMFDKSTQRHRGFGFITFDDDEVSDKVCEIHFHEINGKMVECKKAQPKEVMLPLQLNKTRAAAARNLYGLAPEQLLAYASYMPRLPAGAYAPPAPSAHHHHHGALLAAAGYPSVTAAPTAEGGPMPQGLDLLRIGAAVPSVAHFPGNGHHFAAHPHHHQQAASALPGAPHPHAHHQLAAALAAGPGGVPSGAVRSAAGGHPQQQMNHQMTNNGGGAGAAAAFNPRDLATVQMFAQHQAVHDALLYANQLSSLMAASAADFSQASPYAHHQHAAAQQQQPPLHHHHHHHQGIQFPGNAGGQMVTQPLHSVANQAAITGGTTIVAAGATAQQQAPAPNQQQQQFGGK